MPGYKQTFVEKVKKKNLCLLCTLPMREPVRISSCGHRFCDSCLQEFLSSGVFKCPEDGSALDYAKIYADPEIHTDITSSMIRCVHHRDGCRWIDRLSALQAHLDTCRYDTVPCPNQCAAKLSKICLEDHKLYTCPRRRINCEFCQVEFTGEAMENHQGNCPSETVWCENKCGARLHRKFLNNHMINECHKRTSSCRYCKKQFVYETLQDHYYQCPRFPLTCPNRCDPNKIPRDELENHIKEECPSASAPCQFKDVGCKYVGARFSLEKHMEDAAKQHLTMMCSVSQQQQRCIRDLSEQITRLSINRDGTLVWRITGIKEKLMEAKTKLNTELKSEAFMTSQYGYKLGASVFLNGNGSGERSHLSLYIRVMPGDYDNLLDWPFRLPITFQLLDQCSDPEKRDTITESFVPNPSWKHFQKPSGDVDGMGFGYPKFISHEALFNGTYIRDDQIFIKITVNSPKIIPR